MGVPNTWSIISEIFKCYSLHTFAYLGCRSKCMQEQAAIMGVRFKEKSLSRVSLFSIAFGKPQNAE